MNGISTQEITVGHIPAILWGDRADTAYIYVHGKMSSKADAADLADKATARGCQVLSFDLPEHGGRKDEGYPCNAWNGVHDLGIIGEYARQHWRDIRLFATSLGAYFSLLAYKDLPLTRCLFLSPILDMTRLIQNLMMWFDVSEERLQEEREIPTPMGETLSWDYYCYAKAHPVVRWDAPTAILYGSEDHLTERDVVDGFAQRFRCDLTVLEGSEHYFHTLEQLEYLGQWMDRHI